MYRSRTGDGVDGPATGELLGNFPQAFSHIGLINAAWAISEAQARTEGTEHDVDRVRRAIADRGIDYPVAVDNDYAVWTAFDNHYWPALYFIDTGGALHDHHFGEGRYERSERVIQRLLGVDRDPVRAVGRGVEAEADWDHLRSPEMYLGHRRGERFESSASTLPGHLRGDHWALAGEWTAGPECVVLDRPGGTLACRFHARDAHLVLSTRTGAPVPFRIRLDGDVPGPAHGVDVDGNGDGLLRDGRLYQLVRQRGAVRERTLEITFAAPGVEAYAFHLRVAQGASPAISRTM